MARKLKKRRNGQGDSITLNFNASDPQEAAALAMSKRLAGMKKGKRKDFIVALLAAAEHLYQETGQLIDTYEISTAIMGSSLAASHQPVVPEYGLPRNNAAHSQLGTYARTNIVEIATGKADAKTVAQNFANSMKSFASGFFD